MENYMNFWTGWIDSRLPPLAIDITEGRWFNIELSTARGKLLSPTVYQRASSLFRFDARGEFSPDLNRTGIIGGMSTYTQSLRFSQASEDNFLFYNGRVARTQVQRNIFIQNVFRYSINALYRLGSGLLTNWNRVMGQALPINPTNVFPFLFSAKIEVINYKTVGGRVNRNGIRIGGRVVQTPLLISPLIPFNIRQIRRVNRAFANLNVGMEGLFWQIRSQLANYIGLMYDDWDHHTGIKITSTWAFVRATMSPRRLINTGMPVFGGAQSVIRTLFETMSAGGDTFAGRKWTRLQNIWKNLIPGVVVSPVLINTTSNCVATAVIIGRTPKNKKLTRANLANRASNLMKRCMVEDRKDGEGRKKPREKNNMPGVIEVVKNISRGKKWDIDVYDGEMSLIAEVRWVEEIPKNMIPKRRRVRNEVISKIWILGSHAIGLREGDGISYDICCNNRLITSRNPNLLEGVEKEKMLKRNEVLKRKPFIITYDFETYVEEIEDMVISEKTSITPYLGGFYDGKEDYIVYGEDNVGELFVDMLFKYIRTTFLKKGDGCREITMVAHNGGKFDIHFILEKMISREDVRPSGLIVRDGRILQIVMTVGVKGEKKGVKIRFIDSYSFMSSSLKDLSRDFATVQKGEMDYAFFTKYSRFLSKKHEALMYFDKDLKSLYQVVENYDNIEFGISGIHPFNFLTISSYIRETWRMSYYNSVKYPIFRLVQKQEDWIRNNFYKGGNADVGYLGDFNSRDGEIHHLDVTSEYPFIMATMKIPYGIGHIITGKDTEGILEKIVENEVTGFFQIRVKNTKPRNQTPFCIFPVKRDGRTIFPYFKEYSLIHACTPEIREAIRLDIGYDIEILHGTMFDSAIHLDDFTKERFQAKRTAKAEGNLAKCAANKIAINSFYGSMAMMTEGVSYIFSKSSRWDGLDMLDAGLLINARKIGKFMVYSKKEYFPNTMSYVPAAAIISAESRVYLYKLIMSASRNKCKIICFDTDSVMYQGKMPDLHKKLLTKGYEMGGLKPEEEYITRVLSAGVKMYAVEHSDGQVTIKMKGFQQKTEGYRQKWLKKTYNKKEKTILFEKPNRMTGSQFLTMDDFYLMTMKGYSIIQESIRYFGTMNSLMSSSPGETSLKSSRTLVRFRRIYKKGVITEGGKILPPIF